MKPKFHISLGGEHKIFTLWYHYVIDNGYIYKDVWQYVQNLSIDPEEAYAKAKKIAGNVNVVWDVDEDKGILNKMGIRASNKTFDGTTLTWGKKFYGQKISDIIKDEFGIKYISLSYGFPTNPRQCDLDCLAYTSKLPEVAKYLKDLEDEKKRKNELANLLVGTLKESDHIGTVGESIDLDVTVKSAFWVDGYYGSTFLIRMMDNENNSISCFTTSKSFTDVKQNDTLKISGVVKKHDIRNVEVKVEDGRVNVPDVKSTLITRIKSRSK
jgi:hypothetical protein